MIIGNGLLASAFKDYKDSLDEVIFASGVSNSLETRLCEFEREKFLLEKCIKENTEKTIVYFSSFVDSDPRKRMYMLHKEQMGDIIQLTARHYMIIALPQVIGNGGNLNTLINYIVHNLKYQETINVYKDTYKALIDVEDVVKIYEQLKKWKILNMYFSFPYIERLYVEDIVKIISQHLNIEPKINLVESQNGISKSEQSIAVNAIIKNLNIEKEGYIERVIKKYVK